MRDVVIQAQDLSKCYRLGAARHSGMLREALQDGAARVWSRVTGRAAPAAPDRQHWALKDVSFTVRQGEVIGFIGRNGAGKSTLLKILARITAPTAGHAAIRGRIGSLLEVGTGFHPELTGRENIYLNGAILGMSRHDINRNFDAIVAFAEVERFLDTPVKRYSSGMYVRLAFAVAAHLNPEILIVDEVLAVGDAAFQKKCLGKMRDVADTGRTVLFVSHSMSTIQALTQRCVWLDHGQARASGPTNEVVQAYLQHLDELHIIPLDQRTDRTGTGTLRFTGFHLEDSQGRPLRSFLTGQPAHFVIHYDNRAGQTLSNVSFALAVDNHLGQRITHLSTDVTTGALHDLPPGPGQVRISITQLPLMPGHYGFSLYATVGSAIADWVRQAGRFDVENGDFFGTGRLPPFDQATFLIQHNFKLLRQVG